MCDMWLHTKWRRDLGPGQTGEKRGRLGWAKKGEIAHLSGVFDEAFRRVANGVRHVVSTSAGITCLFVGDANLYDGNARLTPRDTR